MVSEVCRGLSVPDHNRVFGILKEQGFRAKRPSRRLRKVPNKFLITIIKISLHRMIEDVHLLNHIFEFPAGALIILLRRSDASRHVDVALVLLLHLV